MDARSTDRIEDLRQIEHLAPIAFAFLLPYLPYWAIVGLALLAVFHALVVSPRLIRATTRPREKTWGFSAGKLIYALGVLALVLIFHGQLWIAAGAWALLAAGDAASNWAGRRWGTSPLPFNRLKTLQGAAAFWIVGTAASWLLMWWNLPDHSPLSPGRLALYAALAGLVCALAESMPAVVDDNLAIVWVGGLTLSALSGIASLRPVASEPLTEAAAATAAVAAAAFILRWISLRGTLLASLFGLLVYSSLGMPAFALLLAFVVLGSLCTKLGFARKARLEVAQANRGRRGVSNVLANGLVPLSVALAGFWLESPVLRLAFAAAVATAALDTVSTEIGQWLGKRPFNPVNFRPVPVGTQGAVSWPGTLAGMGAALSIACLGAAMGWISPAGALVVWLSAVAAGFYESISASLFRYDFPYSDEALNLFSTLFGATAAACLSTLPQLRPFLG